MEVLKGVTEPEYSLAYLLGAERGLFFCEMGINPTLILGKIQELMDVKCSALFPTAHVSVQEMEAITVSMALQCRNMVGHSLRSLITNTHVLHLTLKYVEFPTVLSSETIGNGHLLFCWVLRSEWSIHPMNCTTFSVPFQLIPLGCKQVLF